MRIYRPDLGEKPFDGLSGGQVDRLFPALDRPTSSEPQTKAGPGGFASLLKSCVEQVNETQNASNEAVTKMATGEEKSLHHTMVEMERADISLKLAIQVKSKVLEAYQQLMRISV